MSNISIDFFGTLDQNADFWQEFMKFLILEGHKIYVISGPWPKEIIEKLEWSGFKEDVHWNKVFSVLDYMSKSGFEVWYDEDHDSWYSQEVPWWFSKSRICEKAGVQIHLDSDKRFAPSFKSIATRFIDTTSADDKEQIRTWHRDLKAANTFCDWGDEEYWMNVAGGFVPM